MSAYLLDTGPLIAFLDGRDARHSAVREGINPLSGSLHTTSVIVVEAMFHFSRQRGGVGKLLTFLEETPVSIYDSTDLASLRAAAALMERYAGAPMDFADATLLLLADAQAIYDILTLDRRGFSFYRTPRGKALRMVVF